MKLGMRMKSSIFVLGACLALSGYSAGCGDDTDEGTEEDSGVAGAGGKGTAGKGGAGGTAGKGTAGKGGAGGTAGKGTAGKGGAGGSDADAGPDAG